MRYGFGEFTDKVLFFPTDPDQKPFVSRRFAHTSFLLSAANEKVVVVVTLCSLQWGKDTLEVVDLQDPCNTRCFFFWYMKSNADGAKAALSLGNEPTLPHTSTLL